MLNVPAALAEAAGLGHTAVMKQFLPRVALWLALALVIWFAVAAFGPKFGLIDWKVGFGTMTRQLGIYLIGGVAIVAAIALIVALIGKPKGSWGKALLALAIPAAFIVGLTSVARTAQSVPMIHDVTTDPVDPPQHSARALALREDFGANPVRGFTTPLGEYEEWNGSDIADQTSAQLIAASYPELRSLETAAAPAAAMTAVQVAMEDIGLTDIAANSASGTAQGIAETFVYGFKDDVAARVRPANNGGSIIDFRSTSRVGLSDLGYNAARLVDLREATQARLPQ